MSAAKRVPRPETLKETKTLEETKDKYQAVKDKFHSDVT